MKSPISIAPFVFRPSAVVQEALDDVGRTEDIQFSPDQKRLVIAGFSKHKLLFLDFNREVKRELAVSIKSLDVTSDGLKFPHGVAWLDDDTVVVANRGGHVVIFNVPDLQAERSRVHLKPVRTLTSADAQILKTPGSVCVRWIDSDHVDVFVCNNFVDTVSRHRLRKSGGWIPVEEQILFNKGLDVPDSVTTSACGAFIAVSNHNKHRVDVFSGRSGKLVSRIAGVAYPHGIRFSNDNNVIVVADAGAPLVHVYRSDGGEWSGWKSPVTSIQVMSEEAFRRFSKGRGEGGPKGLDLTADGQVMVVSNEEQPIAFFIIGPLLQKLKVEHQNSDRYQPKLYEFALDLAPKALLRNRHVRLLARQIANARHASTQHPPVEGGG